MRTLEDQLEKDFQSGDVDIKGFLIQSTRLRQRLWEEADILN